MKTSLKFPTLMLCGLLGLGARLGMAFETVVVDAGHGGLDEGTRWYHISEEDLTLAVSHRLAALLRAKGVQVVQTRVDDRYVSLDERAEIANRSRNSLLVSIHFNAARTTSASGFQTYHFFASPSSKVIAESIQGSLREHLTGNCRGVHKNDFAVLSRTNDCAVLVECGFISNKAEAKYYATTEGQEALAEALAAGILRVKPVINNDPPECEDAKCTLYAKKAAEASRKFLLAGRSAESKHETAAITATAPRKPPTGPSAHLVLLHLVRPLKDMLSIYDDRLAAQ